MTIAKILLGSAAMILVSATAAFAGVNLDVNIGQPGYVQPAPVYVAPYPRGYDPGHRNHDAEYWRAHPHDAPHRDDRRDDRR